MSVSVDFNSPGFIPKRFTNYAQIIKQENSRLNKQVENVLRAARIERTKTIMNMENLDLHSILNEVFSGQVFTYPEKSIKITKELKASTSIIHADKLHLTNVLLNLLDNAIKYNNEEVEIKILTKNKGKSIYLSVHDNGNGIPLKLKHKIFNKFYRVPTGNVHNVKGFGLGLFYVKQVCYSHRWKIETESELNRGTNFIIKMKLF